MKIVKGIQIKVSMKDSDEFSAYVAGQLSIKEMTRLHSITFDPIEKKATVIYLTDQKEEKLVRGQRLVEIMLMDI